MAKRKSTKVRDTALCTLILFICVAAPWACEVEPPRIERHPPVKRTPSPADAGSGGESK